MSRKGRHGASWRGPSTDSQAASGVEYSFVSAVAAIVGSDYARSAVRHGGVSRYGARQLRIGSSHALDGFRQRDKLGSAIVRPDFAIASWTSSLLRK